MAAGYSGTSLIRKLGIKEGFRVCLVAAPDGYDVLLQPMPADVLVEREPVGQYDFIQVFVRDRRSLHMWLSVLKPCLLPTGMLWVSWPKRTSPLTMDLTGNIVRENGLGAGLVDVKVCAIDADWSGLKFVYRLKDRSFR